MNGRRVTRRPSRLVLVAVALAARPGPAGEPRPDVLAPTVDRRLDFEAHILPILTRAGCNAGGCHAAGLGVGKNGFYLSLFGFEPTKDYDRITAAPRGRYLDFAAPDESLLLQKPSGTLPHGGGVRLPRDSAAYADLRRWIAAGAPRGDASRHVVRSLEVEPAARIVRPGEQVRPQVTAVYADGSREDVTALTRFESNDTLLAAVDHDRGDVITAGDVPGDVAVVARYRDLCGFVRLTMPRPTPARADFPPPATFIDEHAFTKMRHMGVAPAVPADDGAFLRRLMVDVAGRVPTADEAARFLADPAPDKRAAMIDRVVDGVDYATNFADKWVVLLRSNRDVAGLASTHPLHEWLRQSFQDNLPYDRLVRALLTASGDQPAAGWWRSQQSLRRPEAAENPAERVKDGAEDAAMLFLGQRIACAKCHQHPFDRWSQADYHAFAAFFAQVRVKPMNGRGVPRVVHAHGEARVAHPSTGELLGPVPLAGRPMDVPADEDPRLHLAAWMTAPDNPFFARAIVNRMWAHFFERGLVDPEDDMRETNPPSNPALLDALVADFVAHGFDLKHLVRTICNSRTYQCSATADDGNRGADRTFARHVPRRLKAEVLLDAIDAVAGTRSLFRGVPTALRAMELPDERVEKPFLATFGRQRGAAACECGRSAAPPSLGQSLELMNGAELSQKLADATGRAQRLAADTSRPIEQRIEELFLAAYARRPTAEEVTEVRSHLEGRQGSAEAFADVIWVLVNSDEFLFTR